MKILSKQEVKTDEKDKRDKLISEFSSLQENTDKALSEFNTIKDEKQLELDALEGNLASVKLKHNEFLLTQEEEIAEISARKSVVEEPLDKKIAMIDIKAGELSKFEKDLKIKDLRLNNVEKELTGNRKEFEAELIRLSEMRASAKEHLEALSLAEVRVGKQKDEFLEMSKGFYEKKAETEDKLEKKKITLQSRAKALDGYADSLNNKKEAQDGQEKKLQAWESRLARHQKRLKK